MPGGRPPQGPKLVDDMEGDPETKHRLKVILEQLAGTKTVDEACDELGVSASTLHMLRSRALAAAFVDLEPKPRGRPAAPGETPQEAELCALRGQVNDLRIDLRAAQIREELALLMPHLLNRRDEGAKKNGPPKALSLSKGTKRGKKSKPKPRR